MNDTALLLQNAAAQIKKRLKSDAAPRSLRMVKTHMVKTT